MLSRRRALAPLLAALALGLTAAPAVAQTTPPPGGETPAPPPQPAPEPTVQPGVTAGGVDLSGLTLAQATAKLDAELRPKLQAPFILDAAARKWVLSAKASKLKFDAAKTARRALAVEAGPAAVRVAVVHSRAAVRAFVAEVAKRVHRAPRNATVTITLRRVRLHDGLPGKSLPAVAPVINDALDEQTGAQRLLRQRLTTVKPAVTNAIARRRYGTVITVDKAHFRLRLFKRFRVVKTYGVAVGQPAYPTPSGLFNIVNKQVNPVWSVPNSPWAGELAGTSVEGGSAANPLKARWMGIVNGVGIHGTGEEYSIGSRASHGCIRMRVADVIDLYPRVPVGTAVLLR